MLNLLPAAIDIGSHSSILLIADWNIGPGGKKILQPKVQKIEVCRLGEDIYDSGEISRKRLEELVNILTRFRMTAHGLGASIEAVAMTEAMRKAKNPETVIDAVEKAVWVRPRIITGEEEATYTFRAVTEWHGNDLVTLDIGGGSTELCSGKNTISLPVGALYLFKKMGAIPGPEYKSWAKEFLRENPLKAFAKKPLYLIGGTGTALAMNYLNTFSFDFKAIEDLEINISALEQIITRIANQSKELRAVMPGLDNGRHEVIICGLFWLRSVLEKLHVESFRISTAGLRFGLLYPPLPPEPVKERTKKVPPWMKKAETENAEASNDAN
jgi:exopolyphosphatase/guanosine-5'-triphosphate,3'-diphosphate pyrophosphatase